jgi:L-2,4-diaminobutyric acid acetyltransferase
VRLLRLDGSDEAPNQSKYALEGWWLPIRYEKPEPRDATAMWEIARDSGTLDLNSPYFYLIFSDQFADTSIVARSGNDVVGFVCGFQPPERPEALFIWQIAVAPSHRRQNIGHQLLRELMIRLSDGVRYLEATVTPSNLPSQRMFRSFARIHEAPCEEAPLYGEDLFPAGKHEEEQLLTMGPFERASLLKVRSAVSGRGV